MSRTDEAGVVDTGSSPLRPMAATPDELLHRAASQPAFDAARPAEAGPGRGVAGRDAGPGFSGREMGRRPARTRLPYARHRAGVQRRRDPAHARVAADMAFRRRRRHQVDGELSAPRVHAANAYYYRQSGLDAKVFARSCAMIHRVLEGGQHKTRAELAVALKRAKVPAEGLKLAYIMMHAELEGVICSGPRRGKQFTYALLDERAPAGKPPRSPRRGCRTRETIFHQPRSRHDPRLRVVVRIDRQGRRARHRGAHTGTRTRKRLTAATTGLLAPLRQGGFALRTGTAARRRAARRSCCRTTTNT